MTDFVLNQELHNSSHPELWYLNGTFQVIESTLSHAGILHIGGVGGVGLAVILGIMASLALMIRGTKRTGTQQIDVVWPSKLTLSSYYFFS